MEENTNITLSETPLSQAQMEVAKENMVGKKYVVKEGDGIHAFAVYGVENDSIDTEEGKIPIVVVCGKEISCDNKIAITFRNRYMIYDDFTFGDWAVGNENNCIEDEIIAKLTESGYIEVGSNSDEIRDFLSNPYEVKAAVEVQVVEAE